MSNLGTNGDDVETPEELRERTAGPAGRGDSSFSELRDHLVRDFGSCFAVPNQAVCIIEEMLDELTDLGALNLRTAAAGTADQSSRMFATFQKVTKRMFEKPSLADKFGTLYVCKEPWMDDIIGHRTPTQFARVMGLSKARVDQAVVEAQREFKLPPRPGQRDEQARKNMRTARVKRLNGGKT